MHSFGKRPATSDGSDHMHRERIAPQYKISAAYKRKLRFFLVLPVLSCAILLSHMAQVQFGFRLTTHVLPVVEVWEYLYLSTVVLSLLAWWSLKRNRSSALMIYILASGVFSVLPLVYASAKHYSELSLLLFQKRTHMYLFGQPFPALLYTFLFLSLFINTSAMQCAYKLNHAWKMKGDKAR